MMNEGRRGNISRCAVSSRRAKRPGAFTLVELLVTISIIALLASMVLVALAGVQETAKVDRTRAQIGRLHSLITQRWEEFRIRRVPSVIPPWHSSLPVRRRMAAGRVDLLRELMRMEMPDRKSDLTQPPVVWPVSTGTALYRSYKKRAQRLVSEHTQTQAGGPADWTDDVRGWTPQFESAECLFLIISQIYDGDRRAIEFFSEREIGDIDNDGMPELLDGWNKPIYFLRWAPGFATVGGYQDREAADSFDPTGIYALQGTFALYPLIFSGGPDGIPDIRTDPPLQLIYAATTPPNNPYVDVGGYATADPRPLGAWFDFDGDGKNNSLDNITNHTLAGGI